MQYKDMYRQVDTTRSLDQISDIHMYDFVEFARRIVTAKGICRILDIGCGNSSFLEELTDEVTGSIGIAIDTVHPRFRGECHEHFEAQASGNRLPIASASIDIAVSTWSVSVYGKPDKTNTYIDEIGRILCAGGFASISPEKSMYDRYMHQPELLDKRYHELLAPKFRVVAQSYSRLHQQGFLISFNYDQPSRVRIIKPTDDKS